MAYGIHDKKTWNMTKKVILVFGNISYEKKKGRQRCLSTLTPATISANAPDEPTTTTTTKKTLTNYFPILERGEKSLPGTLARITALDGMSFNVICCSTDIRAGLIATGFKILPTTVNTVRKMVEDYSKKIRNFLITEIFGKITPELV